MSEVKIPYVVWREGRPRFVPGRSSRALAFKGRDLKHKDGRWYSAGECLAFSQEHAAELREVRSRLGRSLPRNAAALIVGQAQGFVYFMRCGDWVKIGFSLEPMGRVAHLHTNQPHEISAVVIVRGTREDERRAHAAVKSERLRGEWFNYTPAVANLISRSLAFGRVMTDHARTENSCLIRDKNQSLEC